MGLCLKIKKKMDYQDLSPDTSSEGLTMYSDSSSTTESSENSETFPGFHQIQLAHFGSQQNIWAAEADRLKAQHTYKGQLKIAIYVNYGLLTAHIISARHLKSKSGATCDSYVKVALMPDEQKRTRCKTEVAPESNNPLYDEKFSFELLDEDIEKRLFVSVWNRDGNRKSCEFLGCMSFGLRNISTHGKSINGFYYLLPGDIGKRKHLQVAETQRSGLMDAGNRNSICSLQGQLPPPPKQPPVKHDMFWMDTHMLTIKRSSRGYGFTISGACPVQVCRVEVGSYAHKIGLKGGDIILKIDGMNVARTNADTVARIIRHSVKQVVLEIQRQRAIEPVRLGALESSPRKPMLTSTPEYNNERPGSRMDSENYSSQMQQGGSSPWRSLRHQPYPTGRTPPRSPSVKSVNSSPGRLERNGAVYPNFDTHDYGWIDSRQNSHSALSNLQNNYRHEDDYIGNHQEDHRDDDNMGNFDAQGFRIPSLPMSGFGAMMDNSNEQLQQFQQYQYSTLPRSMKFSTSSHTKIPTHTSGSGENLHTKDYGWLDNSASSKENISTISSIHSFTANTKLSTAFSTGTLQAHKKKVSFKDF